MTITFKSVLLSMMILAPSPLLGMLMMEHRMPMQYPMQVAYAILLLACLDFATILFIEPYRSKQGKATIAALLGTIAIILLFVIAESLNRFFEHLSYGWLSPFVAGAMLLAYAAIFMEKNVALKCHLSLNTVALQILWIMGAADKVTMPF